MESQRTRQLLDTLVDETSGTRALVATEAATSVAGVDARPGRASPESFDDRYRFEALLGHGGMGEVRLCVDTRIGREVAVKVVRPGAGSNHDRRQRFLREARIQGQLEHPAIVPVHDLSVGADEDIYFTMKRIRGLALDEILGQLETEEPEATARFTLRKLLTAFSQVCLAIHFAHEKGVLHRDLKPANLMLGDFGEVYVLDWGLAKPIGEPTPRPRPPSGPPLELPGDDLGDTAAGSIMGTLGYMAPEQLVDGSILDARTDVYALGAILFEIVTLRPLHERKDPTGLMTATIEGVSATARAAQLGTEAPPELVAICARATATAPADRYASARELHDAVEAYLEGDRDLEQRRRAAASHVHRAITVLRPAGRSPTAEQSARAVQELGRALALDPENADAMSSLVKLLSAPPGDVPAAAQADIDASNARVTREINKAGGWVLVSWFAFLPLLIWMGMRRWDGLIFGSIMIATAATLSFKVSRQPRPDIRLDLGVLVTAALGIATAGLLLGPIFLMPGVAAVFAMAFAFKSEWWWAWLGVGTALATIVVPAFLQFGGVLPPSMGFEDGVIQIIPHAVSFPELPTTTFLVMVACGMVIASGLLAAWMRRALGRAEQRLVVQTWLLRQLVPPKARDAIAPRRGTHSGA